MKTIVLLLVYLLVSTASAKSLQLISEQDPSAGISVTASGDSALPIISPDGGFVLFSSTANNLVLTTNAFPIQTPLPASYNVYLYDRTSNTTALLTMGMDGASGATGNCVARGISTNGRWVLFEGSASNLVPNISNTFRQVFLRDLVNQTTMLVSGNTNGTDSNGDCYNSVMTPDGRYVAFTGLAMDLVANDTNGISDVFVRDLQTGTTVCATVGARSTGSSILPSLSDDPVISSDGRYVGFFSTATNVVSGGKLAGEVYIRDLTVGTTLWVSAGARNLFKSVTGSSNAVSCNLSLSADGNFIAFETCTNSATAWSSSGIILRYDCSTGLTDFIHTNAFVSVAK